MPHREWHSFWTPALASSTMRTKFRNEYELDSNSVNRKDGIEPCRAVHCRCRRVGCGFERSLQARFLPYAEKLDLRRRGLDGLRQASPQNGPPLNRSLGCGRAWRGVWLALYPPSSSSYF